MISPLTMYFPPSYQSGLSRWSCHFYISPPLTNWATMVILSLLNISLSHLAWQATIIGNHRSPYPPTPNSWYSGSLWQWSVQQYMPISVRRSCNIYTFFYHHCTHPPCSIDFLAAQITLCPWLLVNSHFPTCYHTGPVTLTVWALIPCPVWALAFTMCQVTGTRCSLFIAYYPVTIVIFSVMTCGKCPRQGFDSSRVWSCVSFVMHFERETGTFILGGIACTRIMVIALEHIYRHLACI